MKFESGDGSPAEVNKSESGENLNMPWLKTYALNLKGVHLSGPAAGDRADRIVDYSPGEWNEHNGIIMFASPDDGELYAIPATDSVREKLNVDPAFTRADSTKGVINLNETDGIWGGAEKNAQNSGYQRWRTLALGAQNMQMQEAADARAAQAADRDAFDAELDARGREGAGA
jgi:hypothetical protein